MKWGGILVTALLFAVVPAAAKAIGPPLPPVYAPTTYVVAGQLSNYVPATPLASGSITIKVMSASANAIFSRGETLIFSITPATRLFLNWTSGVRNGSFGQIRIVTGLRMTTLAALQAQPAASLIVSRPPEQNTP